MSSSGNPLADLMNSMATGGTQSAGSQAQFGLLLQLLQRIYTAILGQTTNGLYDVYPITAAGDLTIATAFPGITAGTFSIRKTVAAATAVTLPTSGGPWAVFDGNGGASAHNITVTAPGGFTINGASTYVISTNWEGATFVLDASNYIAET